MTRHFRIKNRPIDWVKPNVRNARTYSPEQLQQLARVAPTDTPYNVDIQGHVGGLGKHQHRELSMASGEMSPQEYIGFLTDSFIQLARASEGVSVKAK